MSETVTTLDEIDVGALPAASTTEQAARLLGISRVGLWKMAEAGTAPVPHFKVGRALRWPTAPILRLLRLDESDPCAADPSPEDPGTRSAINRAGRVVSADPLYLFDEHGVVAVMHSQRFRKVANRYPRRVAEAYGGDIARAALDSDGEVAATVAEWERRHGDWPAIGAHERDEPAGA